MSNFQDMRLETPGGTVVAYLAPGFSAEPASQNDLFHKPMPEAEDSIAKDYRLWTHEVVIQGAFEHTDTGLPNDHVQALSTLFGGLPVTPAQQAWRVWYYLVVVGGPFHLYDGHTEWRATTRAAVDYQAGVFPPVQAGEIRSPQRSGQSRREWLLRFVAGFEDL